MPRAFVATPASALKDNVAGLLSRPVGDGIESSWLEQEANRRRKEYSAELRSQIVAKEAARQLEQTRRPAAAATVSPTADEHSGTNDPESANAHTTSDADDKTMMALPAIRTAAPPPTAPPLPPCPTLTEKERFIAAMERGITTTPKNARRRSFTAPVPASAPTITTPHHRPGSAPGDDAALRALMFKLELDQQIEEKKRLKTLERERERQWEAEQEERLERERAQLRQQFEEEHAARRAKVAADAASGASKGGPGIQIYAPKRKPGGAAGTAGATAATARKSSRFGSAERSQSDKFPAENGASNNAPEKAEAPSQAASAVVAASVPCAGQASAQGLAPATDTIKSLEETSDPAAMAAACFQLAGQVAELRRLHEAVRRELSLHKAVLDATKEVYLATATTLVTLTQMSGASGSGSGSSSVALPLPILHTTAELRTEDSRPSTSRMPLQAQRRGGPAPAATRSKLGGGAVPRPAVHAAPLRGGAQGPSILAETVAEKLENLRLAEREASEAPMLIAAVPSSSHRPRPPSPPPALTAAKLVPVWRSERAGFWKIAGNKLRKLTVAKTAGAADGRWVEQEDSRSSTGGFH